jgi:hypothetical protein
MTFLRIVIPLYLFDLRMISAQTRSVCPEILRLGNIPPCTPELPSTPRFLPNSDNRVFRYSA